MAWNAPRYDDCMTVTTVGYRSEVQKSSATAEIARDGAHSLSIIDNLIQVQRTTYVHYIRQRPFSDALIKS